MSLAELDVRYAIAAVALFWLCGTVIGTAVMALGNRRDDDAKILPTAILNFVLWPFILPSAWHRLRLHREMAVGTKPHWLIYDKGENDGNQWTLSDGNEFLASASCSEGQSCEVQADYANDFTGQVEVRAKMIEPDQKGFSAWVQMTIAKHRKADGDSKDDNIREEEIRYEARLPLARGKHQLEFRVENKDGERQVLSGVTVIIADESDYS